MVAALGFRGSVALALATRGSTACFAATGPRALPFLVGVAVRGSRLGIGLPLAAVIAGHPSTRATGRRGGGVALAHVGASGAAARRFAPSRAVRIGALPVGVAPVRAIGRP